MGWGGWRGGGREGGEGGVYDGPSKGGVMLTGTKEGEGGAWDPLGIDPVEMVLNGPFNQSTVATETTEALLRQQRREAVLDQRAAAVVC